MKTIVVLIALIAITGPGCAHHQLRYQMANQAQTVQHTFEEQVLDNLAMYCVRGDGVPFLTIPNEGATNVNGEASISSEPPLNPFLSAFAVGAQRSNGNSWTLTPVTDEYKLRNVRNVLLGAVSETGWLECSTRKGDIPKCCKTYGEFCGTYVWVKSECETRFAELVFDVLKAATTDEIVLLKRTKTVTVFIDKDGQPVKESDSIGQVEAVVALDAHPVASATQINEHREIDAGDISLPANLFKQDLDSGILKAIQRLDTLGNR
jgi:hypothetical protein